MGANVNRVDLSITQLGDIRGSSVQGIKDDTWHSLRALALAVIA